MAVYPIASGASNADYSGSYIPEIYSGKILETLYGRTVFGDISNTDYEGEIKNQGDTVIIRGEADITVSPYEIGDEIEGEDIDPKSIELKIDKGFSWSFKLNDVSQKQMDLDYPGNWTQTAGKKVQKQMDALILSDIWSEAYSQGTAGDSFAGSNFGSNAGLISQDINLGKTNAPLEITKNNVVDVLIDMRTVLSEQNLEDEYEGVWTVIPTWMAALIKKSDLGDASIAGDGTSIRRNGRIGSIDGMTLYSSNHVHSVIDDMALTGDASDDKRCFYPIFGHKMGLTFASQLVQNVGPMQMEKHFAKKWMGLNVFGYKVVKPEVMGYGYVTKG